MIPLFAIVAESIFSIVATVKLNQKTNKKTIRRLTTQTESVSMRTEVLMFINLTNHPTGSWSKFQLEAARSLELGDVRDLDDAMPLPLVHPKASTEEVTALAESLAARALGLGARAALVQGEFTLTFALVLALQRHGVRCFAATTERIVREEPSADGASTVKRSEFTFVKFREYPEAWRSSSA